jgi:predicted tellurium resistance membrane protein TerC
MIVLYFSLPLLLKRLVLLNLRLHLSFIGLKILVVKQKTFKFSKCDDITSSLKMKYFLISIAVASAFANSAQKKEPTSEKQLLWNPPCNRFGLPVSTWPTSSWGFGRPVLNTIW